MTTATKLPRASTTTYAVQTTEECPSCLKPKALRRFDGKLMRCDACGAAAARAYARGQAREIDPREDHS